MAQTAYAIHIAGVGDQPTAAPNGTLWATPAAADLDGQSFGDWSVNVALDGQSTQAVEFAANPFKAGADGIASSAYTFVFPARDDIMGRFMHAQHKTDLRLGADIDENDSDIKLDLSRSTLSPGALDDSVVYIGKETIRLGAYNSSSGAYESCDRGFYGSPQKPHAQGANVYDRHEPHWDERDVVLFRIDLDEARKESPTAPLSIVWLGSIDLDESEEIQTTAEGANIRLPAVDITAGTQDVTVRQQPNTTDNFVPTHLYREPLNAPDGQFLHQVYTGILSVQNKVEKPVTGSVKYDHSSTFVRVGDTVCALYNTRVLSSYDVQDLQPVLGSPVADTEKLEKGQNRALYEPDEPPHEVFVIDRSLDRQSSSYPSFLPDRLSQSRELDGQPNNYNNITIPAGLADRYPYHPLAIAAAFELSTTSVDTTPEEFDVFGSTWALDRRDLYADDIIEQVHGLIAETPQFQIDQLVLGYDREPVNIVEKVDRLLLHPFGFFRALDSSGKLTFKRLRFASVKDLLDANGGAFDAPVQPIPAGHPDQLLQMKSGRGSTVDSVVLRYNGLPWRDKSSVYFNNVDGDGPDNSSGKKPQADFELDFSTVRQAGTVLRRAEQAGMTQTFQIPRLRFRAEDMAVTGADYSVGEFISLADLPLERAFLVGPDGERTNATKNKAEFSGMVTGWKYDLVRGTYMLEILLINYVEAIPLQLRAPSAILIDVDTDGSGNVERVYVDGDSEFGGLQSDALEFAIGDDVQFCDQIGRDLNATPAEIAALNTGVTTPNTAQSGAVEVVLDTAVPSADAPSAGDIMRFSNYDGYSNPGHGGQYLTGYGDIHAWLGDSVGTLGSNDIEVGFYG